MIKLLIIGSLLITSLIRPVQFNNIPDLNMTNRIEIHYLKSENKFTITSKETIGFFTDLVENCKNKGGLKCDSTGEVLYLHNNQQLFKIYFSTRITGSRFTTDAITYTINNHPTYSLLTYNTGMSIDEIFSKLNKSH